MVSIVLHTLAIAALYGAGRWHQKRIEARERIKARLGKPMEWEILE